MGWGDTADAMDGRSTPPGPRIVGAWAATLYEKEVPRRRVRTGGAAAYTRAVSEDHLRETGLDSRVVHAGRFITFRVDRVRDARGKEHPREVVDHPGAVAIVALAGDEVLLVRQFRWAVGEVCLEIPAGTLDRDGEGVAEEPDAAAPRELEEETGHRARSWRKLGRFYTAPGFADEEMHLYLARELTPLETYTGPDVDEYLDLVRMPWREAVESALAGEIRDAKTLVGLMWLDRLAARGAL